MIEILAAAGAEGNGIGWLGIPAGGAGAALLYALAIGARRFFSHGVTITVPGEDHESQRKQYDHEEKEERSVCPAHDAVVKLLDERNTVITESLSEMRTEFHAIREEVREGNKTITDTVGTIHRRIDAILSARANQQPPDS